MTDLINELILLLDTNEDNLLIELLKRKLDNTPFSQYNPHFSKKELAMTESGLNTQLRNYLGYNLPSSNDNSKAESILSKNECRLCPRSIKKDISYLHKGFRYQNDDLNYINVMNPDSDICISCDKWKDKLQNICNSHDMNVIFFTNTLITEDVIKTKAIINKLQRKIKQLCAQ